MASGEGSCRGALCLIPIFGWVESEGDWLRTKVRVVYRTIGSLDVGRSQATERGKLIHVYVTQGRAPVLGYIALAGHRLYINILKKVVVLQPFSIFLFIFVA